MSTPIEYASFIIRISRMSGVDADGNPYDWQSEVEHIQVDRPGPLIRWRNCRLLTASRWNIQKGWQAESILEMHSKGG